MKTPSAHTCMLHTKNNYNTGTTQVKSGWHETILDLPDGLVYGRKRMQTNAGENVISDQHSPHWRKRLMYESGLTGWAPPPAQKNQKQDCWGSNHLALTNSGTGTESRICYLNTRIGGASAL